MSRTGEERTFSFDRGQILFTSSNREAQLVGELLRTFGLADESLLMSAFEKALNEPGRGLARALSESGAVPSYVAEAAVRALSERLFFDTLKWTSGRFTVTPLDVAPDVPAKMDRPTGECFSRPCDACPCRVPAQFSSIRGRGRVRSRTSCSAIRRSWSRPR